MNSIRTYLLAALAALLTLFAAGTASAAPGDLDPLNLNLVGSNVLATAVQPDGKTILAGGFSSVLGVARNNLARLDRKSVV